MTIFLLLKKIFRSQGIHKTRNSDSESDVHNGSECQNCQSDHVHVMYILTYTVARMKNKNLFFWILPYYTHLHCVALELII